MGYDIKLVNLTINGNTVTDYTTVAETYISYNWSIWFKNIWYIRDHDGSSSNAIYTSLNSAISVLENEEIKTGVPDPMNSGWGFGIANINNNMSENRESPLMSEPERKSIFLYHLKNLLALAIRYPNAYWITDSNYAKSINHVRIGTVLLSELDDDYTDDADVDTNETYPFTYFRHPVKGNIKVSTFDDCMEIFGILRMQGNQNANSWKSLAFKMRDAPRIGSKI